MDIKGFLNAAKSAITSSASMQEKENFVDTEMEKNTLGTIFKGINKAASESKNIDTVEFKNLVAQEKEALTPFVEDAEILADLMSALSEVAPELDMAKIDKYNKEHPALEENAAEYMETVTNNTGNGYVGMDVESYNTISEALGENATKVFHYMSDAIKSGDAARISKRVEVANEKFHELIDAGIDKPLEYIANRTRHNRAILSALRTGDMKAVELHEVQKSQADNRAALNKLRKEKAES